LDRGAGIRSESFVKIMSSELDPDAPIPFGIRVDTGRPLNGLSDETMDALVGHATLPGPDETALANRSDAADVAFAMEGGLDAKDLAQSGWGVIYSPSVSHQIKDALQPLLDHRKKQAEPFKVFDGPDGYLPGDTANDWLKRHKVRQDVVNPDSGVPFYLLLVGPPEEMPFEFQYSLDIYWAVGRLWFETSAEFRRYAESVIQYEDSVVPVPTSRSAAMFATEHDFDDATQLFTRLVARPLAEGEDGKPTVWQKAKFGFQPYLGEKARRSNLANILRGKDKGTPSLLVSGSHGLECSLEDPRQREIQGAVVCQDWTGYGQIKSEHWFGAAEVPEDARLQGMIHFFFACYGGGCTELDNYDRLNNEPRRIAKQPFFSRLPQKMLSHPNGGALAMLAHIERAWAYSFQGQRGGQVQGFRDVIGRLLRGERIGQATDQFNLRWAAISTDLSEMQAELARGAEVKTRTLANLWIARDDARNYMILGDPAVRLRVEDMPQV
jgi:hypothetical protein